MFRKLVLSGAGSLMFAAALAFGAAATRWETAQALTNCTTGTAAMDASEQQVLSLINAYRQENGLPALKHSPNLSRAAAWMAEDLTSHGAWSHTDSYGRLPFTRVIDCGYLSQGAGENLAMTSSAAGAVNLWKGSPGHSANMLNPAWKVAGIGHAGSIWAADFGVIDDSGATAPPPPPATSTATSPAGSGGNPPTQAPTAPPTAPLAPTTPVAKPIIRRAMVQMISVE